MDALELSVIIPTTAQTSRKKSLFRSINSCLDQANLNISIIVVVNGNKVDEEFFNYLNDISYLTVYRLTEGNVAKARYYGLRKVATKYYAFLDDDDQYISNSLQHLVKELNENADADLVVAPGFKKHLEDELKTPFVKCFPAEHANPLESLENANWLASCGGIYNKNRVDMNIFDNLPPYFEWTYTAIRIGQRHKVFFHQTPCFIINQTEGSISSTLAYDMFEIKFLKDVINNYDLPRGLRTHYQKKLASKYNMLANLSLENRNRLTAAKHHAKCLTSSIHGLSYLPWTRKLFQ
jgi:glycosyltransferase involved in cell wall biosynthesis